MFNLLALPVATRVLPSAGPKLPKLPDSSEIAQLANILTPLRMGICIAAYTGPTPSGWCSERTIHAIKLEPDTEDASQSCSCDLLFQHTPTYPEELPMVKLSNTRGLTNKEVDALSALLLVTAQENVGMASVFAIMQTAQEWMENKAGLQLGALPCGSGALYPSLFPQSAQSLNHSAAETTAARKDRAPDPDAREIYLHQLQPRLLNSGVVFGVFKD
jgi:hypothetical protein